MVLLCFGSGSRKRGILCFDNTDRRQFLGFVLDITIAIPDLIWPSNALMTSANFSFGSLAQIRATMLPKIPTDIKVPLS